MSASRHVLDREIRRTAREVREQAKRVHEATSTGPHYATVLDTSPLAAQMILGKLTLDDDDLVLGQWATNYDATVGIAVDDTLILHRMADGDWLVVEVVSANNPTPPASPPLPHHVTHEPGGSDPMAVDAAAGTGSLRTLGPGAQQSAAGNDSRFTNARTPTAHASTHQPGGSDAMAVDAAAGTGSLRTVGAGALQAAPGALPVVSSLPGSPVDGQRIYYVASGDVVWDLVYRSSTGKWHYVGGPPLYDEQDPGGNNTSETTTATGYGDLTSVGAHVGPLIALPLAGDYDVAIGFTYFNSTAGTDGIMSYAIGGTGASDADMARVRQPNTNGLAAISAFRERRKTGLTAVTLTSKYKGSGGGTYEFLRRWMRVTPVRVG